MCTFILNWKRHPLEKCYDLEMSSPHAYYIVDSFYTRLSTFLTYEPSQKIFLRN